MPINRRFLRASLSALLLFAGNAYLCHNLFHTEFTGRMESIEGSYMSISRWAMHHWGDLRWFPLWFEGTPFQQVYQPGFHLTVAAIGTVMGWSAQHAYHFFTAFEYCLGPVSLFLLCYCATGWLGYSLATGVIYSLLSPASLVAPAIRHDTGGLVIARRFLILVHYGEGPHTTAVMMIPLVLLAVHYAATERRRWALAAAPLALAAIALTNWPGSMGLCLALTAYLFSRFRAERPVHWPALLGVAAIAYLLACPWIPPSILRLVQRNAALSDGLAFGVWQVLGLLGILAGMLLFHYWFQRRRVDPWLRFFVYFAWITGVLAIGHVWFGWRILPQSGRFQMEFEMPCAALLAWIGKLVYDRSPKALRLALIALLAVACIYAGKQFRRFAKQQTRPIDIAGAIEYRMARWFDAHMQGRRVFAPGNVALWMNLFTETPQMAGCCDQGIPVQEHRIAGFVIYSDMNAGARAAEISLLWLKAYGVDAIGMSGPNSTEYFHPYWHPYKFDGVLPVLWRDGDNAVYSVDRRGPSLAHVVQGNQLVVRPPAHGLDVEPLVPYVNAIEAPDAPPASFRWVNLHHARIQADVPAGRLVSVQISYDPGWRVTVAGERQRAFSDALGLMAVDPHCAGNCVIDLDWDGGAEARWMRVLQAIGFLLLAASIAMGFRAATRGPGKLPQTHRQTSSRKSGAQ